VSKKKKEKERKKEKEISAHKVPYSQHSGGLSRKMVSSGPAWATQRDPAERKRK
jgi:hypothetical protein